MGAIIITMRRIGVRALLGPGSLGDVYTGQFKMKRASSISGALTDMRWDVISWVGEYPLYLEFIFWFALGMRLVSYWVDWEFSDGRFL